MSQYTRPPNDECSEMFLDARANGGGGAWVNCSCDIDHFAVDSEFYLSYDEKIPKESKTVKHHHGVDSVDYLTLENQQFVYDCDGCRKSLKKYEDFIWRERHHIRNYLRIRIDQEKAWADQENTLNILAGIKNG